uniref:Uncharacterized protein n=1 Tax=Bursaphelenchus xylophilus TaxID=6326 RepID=A0A1I7SPI0_BURXY
MQLADLNQAAVHSIMENCWNKRKEWRKRQQSSQEAKEPTAVTYDGSNVSRFGLLSKLLTVLEKVPYFGHNKGTPRTAPKLRH